MSAERDVYIARRRIAPKPAAQLRIVSDETQKQETLTWNALDAVDVWLVILLSLVTLACSPSLRAYGLWQK